MNQISPYQVWIGHAGNGRDVQKLFDLEIRAIVQLAWEEAPIALPRDMLLHRFPLLDGSGNEADVLLLAIECVAGLIARQKPTLVCCGAGMSRSPAIVAAGLAVSQQERPEDCLQYVSRFHRSDVSPGFWNEICQVVSDSQTGGAPA